MNFCLAEVNNISMYHSINVSHVSMYHMYQCNNVYRSMYHSHHGCFFFYSWLSNYNSTIFKILFLCSVITFFASLAPIIVMVAGDCCVYVYCVNVHFLRKKDVISSIMNSAFNQYKHLTDICCYFVH